MRAVYRHAHERHLYYLVSSFRAGHLRHYLWLWLVGLATMTDAYELDKWFARRWLAIVVGSFAAGVMFTLVIVMIVMLMHAAV